MYRFIVFLFLMPSIALGQNPDKPYAESLEDFNNYKPNSYAESAYERPVAPPEPANSQNAYLSKRSAQSVVEKQPSKADTKNEACNCAYNEETQKFYMPDTTNQVLVSQKSTDNFYDWQLWKILRVIALIFSILVPVSALLLRVFLGAGIILTA